jgi:hypothetical protein
VDGSSELLGRDGVSGGYQDRCGRCRGEFEIFDKFRALSGESHIVRVAIALP